MRNTLSRVYALLKEGKGVNLLSTFRAILMKDET